MMSTIGLDLLNHHLALQNNFLDDTSGVAISKEDKEKREKIPKRATIINTCLFVPWIAYTAVVGNTVDLDLETKTLLVTLPNAIVNGLRNPLIGRLAVHVNTQIMRQTVEDRRNAEIAAAMKKREDRRRQKELENDTNIDDPPPPRARPNPQKIPTVSEVHPLPRQWSLTSIHV